jgi:hypothetical protein
MSIKVLIPIYRAELSGDEEISFASIRKVFPAEKICFVAPRSLDLYKVLQEGESHERFDDEFFDGIAEYNRLLTSVAFYERFDSFSHILICQLDCLVFRDELEHWAEQGHDYIAAPWFREFLEKPKGGLWRVGNGGFSLRKVQSCLRVLRKKIPCGTLYPHCGSNPWEPNLPEQDAGSYRWRIRFKRLNPFVKRVTVEEEVRSYRHHEDLFWSIEAVKIDESFRVASAEEALPFAFEMAPRWCFEKNARKLPFGAHAWARYDKGFWETILKEDVGLG